ncbi:sorting-associated protein 16 homolog [Seminavis robusta]|uniref:Sorting-associated protein 16 homolog n=1 Tax=Seminavis robusta TaxID=568900 RepID=A0A9N8DMI7_9STRA|nr:sorting-associated protein 16 homolog [Seminavis robusta]|eukprot:Sro229_g092880.1 sorting-associated protein 16 homolog (1099) ;mRNA; f:7863-11418
MTQGSNPFDDGYDDTAVKSGSSSNIRVSSKNPFDNDDVNMDSGEQGVAPAITQGINPFDTTQSSSFDNPMASANPTEDSQDEPLEGLQGAENASAEASWQYLGDLPYRRVPVYSNVSWNRIESSTSGKENNNPNQEGLQYGLAAFPPAVVQHHPQMLDEREVRALLNTTTVTKVAGCPHGGPVAAITLPIVGHTGAFTHAELRIMTNSGLPLSTIEFPPPNLERQKRYTAADILSMGFTDRYILVVVLRDSLCLTYDLRGDVVLQPFHIMPRGEGKAIELIQANIFDGGAAVLASSKQSALVEILDDHDPPDYYNGAHIAARRILPTATATSEAFGGQDNVLPPHYAIVTHLDTAAYASTHFHSYLSVAALSRTRTSSGHPDVYLSTSDNSVLVINTVTGEIIDVDCRARISAPIVDMTFAPNGRFLACFTESSMLTVISTSFETKVLDFDTSEGSASPPLAMKWCGEDSVVLHWKNLGVLMVGPYGDWLRFPYEDSENVFLIPEVDCCRVLTDSSVEMLQRVPPSTARLLRIGSIEPSAMLLDASDAFDSGSPASEEAAQAIVKTGALLEAIETCTEAATREFDIATQKRLLSAASYGMHFSYKDNSERSCMMGGPLAGSDEECRVRPSHTTVKFVAAARKLRILNSLRNPNVGFILTASQFDAMSPTGLVARLIAMKRPALATSISKYLGLPKAVQLYARASKASALVASDSQRGHSDTEIADAAIKMINEDAAATTDSKTASTSINRGGYATVALAANKAGRPGVANLLLMLESSVADKVPALISTGSFADAMAVATTARDADFIFATLMEYEKTCMSTINDPAKAQATFLATVVSKFTKEGYNMMRRYYSTLADVKHLMNLQLRAQKFTDAGCNMAARAMEKTETDDAREKHAMLTEASRIFGLGKETTFHKACTDDYLELLKDQEVLRTKYGVYEVAPDSTSVTALMASVIHYAALNQREQHRLLADADKIAKKFRIPEKRVWHIKIKAFADSKQWSNLRLLSDSKAKSPVGYKPFARVVIKGKQSVSEIMRYIDRVTFPEERYDLLCEAELWKPALEEAAKMRDARRILNVKSLCNDSEIQLLAEQYMGRIA